MTDTVPLGRVCSILTDAGYAIEKSPFRVNGVPFSFGAVLIAPPPMPDLVIVEDTLSDGDVDPYFRKVQQRIEAFTRALDLIGSRRPVTAIFVGPRPGSDVIGAISRVCRVLPVGNAAGDDSDIPLRDWLAALLPFDEPNGSGVAVDSVGELLAQLPNANSARVHEYLNAAERSSATVRDVLRSRIVKALKARSGR